MNAALRKGALSSLLARLVGFSFLTWPVRGHSLPIVLIVPGTQTHTAPFTLAQGSRVKFPNKHLLLDSFLSARWFEVLSRIPTYQKAQERSVAVEQETSPHATDSGSKEIGAKMRPLSQDGNHLHKFSKNKKQINTRD